MVELGEVADLIGGGTPSTSKKDFWINGVIKWISAKHINKNNKIIGYELITQEAVKNSSTVIIPKGSIIFVTRVSTGKLTKAENNYAINQDLTGIILKNNKIDATFLFHYLRTQTEKISKLAQGMGVKGITKKQFASVKIPLPPLYIQKQLVAETEKEEEIITANKKLIEIMERKIEKVIAEI